MGVGKEFIKDEATRNVTFRKRSATLKKNARDLEMLCNITTLMVCLGPNGQVVTWPEKEEEIREIYGRYRELSPSWPSKYKLNLTNYLDRESKNCPGRRHTRRGILLTEKSDKSSAKELRSIDSELLQVKERIEFLGRRENSLEFHGGGRDFEATRTSSPPAMPVVIDLHDDDEDDNGGETTATSSQNCEENSPSAEQNQNQNAGFCHHPYGAIWPVHWQWMNYWRGQMIMDPYMQYPNCVPLVFAPPPSPPPPTPTTGFTPPRMLYGQHPYDADLMAFQPPPLAVAPPPEGFAPLGMQPVRKNIAKREKGE